VATECVERVHVEKVHVEKVHVERVPVCVVEDVLVGYIKVQQEV
jgi:hypothetical protein